MIYSIIIPHKNVPDLLERLLNSIPVREDTEIIIIDDHSDPEKVDFDSFPGLKRENTQVVFLDESKGAGFARNLGISKAVGKWLLFADADDFYTDKLNDLLDRFKDDAITDVVYLNAQKYYENNGVIQPMYFSKYFDRYEKNKLYAEKVIRYNIWTPWTRMVKREFVERNSLRYEEIPVGNDKMFCLGCSQFAKNIEIEKKIVYNYFVPENGSVTFSYTKRKDKLQSSLELKNRVNHLYSQVDFIFKQSYLQPYLKNLTSENSKYTMKFMKSNSIGIFKDLYYAVIYSIGKILGII